MAHRLSRSIACEIFPVQGLKLSPALPGDFLSTGPPRKSKEGALSSKILYVVIVHQLGCGQRLSTSIFEIQQLKQRGKDKRKMCVDT